jgi:hypothetical protein
MKVRLYIINTYFYVPQYLGLETTYIVYLRIAEYMIRLHENRYSYPSV